MRGAMGTSPTPVEARHRLSASNEDTNKRRFQRSRNLKDVEKATHSPIQDRNSICKITTLKLVMVIIISGMLLTLFHSPAVYNTDQLSNSGSSASYYNRFT
ncbi:hypothetical protein L1049_026866 [Liquidambar formosana]|uniref:Uncharacterized protein n=1 Tax=Liquidambar formosana TaxID=63359 RepID=A0AAP0R936_LIQFO